jgi:hypothetical protein
MERVEPIILTDNETGATYTLEFDRETVRDIEAEGFMLKDLEGKPSKYYDLFYNAFRMHHRRDFASRRLTRKKTDEMLDAIGGPLNAPTGLFERLVDLYIQTFNTLTDGDEKNARVTVKF